MDETLCELIQKAYQKALQDTEEIYRDFLKNNRQFLLEMKALSDKKISYFYFLLILTYLNALVSQAKTKESQTYQPSALALIIDQIPEIQRHLRSFCPGLHHYYDKALPFTQKDVDKNISAFFLRYELKVESLDCQNLSDAALLRKYFFQWVMMILKADCLDEWRKQKKIKMPIKEVSMNQQIGGSSITIKDTIAAPTLSGLEKIYQQEQKLWALKLRLYVEKDPDGKLKNCYPKKRGQPDSPKYKPARPHCNCQVLIAKRFLEEPPCTYQEISEELNIPLPTIQSRVEKHCLPLLKEIANQLITEELEANPIRSQEHE